MDGLLLTIGFAVVLFGTMIGLVLLAMGWIAMSEGVESLQGDPKAAQGSVASIPPVIARVLAWSFPIAYAAALGYAVLVLSWVVGRGWTRRVGLRHVPVIHVVLALIALPGFILGSDFIARVLFQAFGKGELLDQSGQLGELFRSFHWTFVVLALGVGPGIVEELWCRGFLGRGFVSRYGWLRGVALASFFFGLLHAYPPAYVLTTAAMGLGLHFAYAMSRSLWVPMMVHTLNNSFAGLIAVGAIPSEGMDRALTERLPVLAILTVAVLALSALAMWSARLRLVAAVELGASDSAQPIPRGVMVPPAETGIILERSRISWPCAVGAAVCSLLLWYCLFA
jgi:membrane protease YdiL (CAAX protease family)